MSMNVDDKDDKELLLLVSRSVLINNPKAKLVKFLHSITCYRLYLRYYLRRSYRPLKITENSHKEVKFSHINSVFPHINSVFPNIDSDFSVSIDHHATRCL